MLKYTFIYKCICYVILYVKNKLFVIVEVVLDYNYCIK